VLGRQVIAIELLVCPCNRFVLESAIDRRRSYLFYRRERLKKMLEVQKPNRDESSTANMPSPFLPNSRSTIIGPRPIAARKAANHVETISGSKKQVVFHVVPKYRNRGGQREVTDRQCHLLRDAWHTRLLQRIAASTP
jgi:hypothetical protein